MTRETSVQLVEKVIVKSITCNICQKKVDLSQDELSFSEDNFFENIFAQINWTAGFGSQFDMERFNIDICDQCINAISKGEVKR